MREDKFRKEFFENVYAVVKSRYMAEAGRSSIPTDNNAYTKDKWDHMKFCAPATKMKRS